MMTLQQLKVALLAQIQNATAGELCLVQEMLAEANKKLEDKLVVKSAKATFPEDQKFVDTIELKSHAHYEEEPHCIHNCDRCSEMEWEAMSNFAQHLHFDLGFTSHDISLAIPDFFEGETPALIAEFACSRMTIKITHDKVEFANAKSNIVFPGSEYEWAWEDEYDEDLVDEGENTETMIMIMKERIQNRLMETFPILTMMIDMKQIVHDLGFGDFFNYENEELRHCFPWLKWNWPKRLLSLERVPFLGGGGHWGWAFHWPLETVKKIADALAGRGQGVFVPSDGSDVKAHLVKFVKEESEFCEFLWEKEMGLGNFRDPKTKLLDRSRITEEMRAKKRRLV